MKSAHTTLLVSALIVATYIAAPGAANAGGRECITQSLTKTAAAEKVDADLDVAKRVARTGRSVRKEVDALDVSVKSESSAWVGFPNQCLIQDMLDHEMADLHARADAFRAVEADFLQFQFQVAMARYERAVEQIAIAWKNGEIAEDIAYKAQYELRLVTFEYLESLGTVSIRERLQEAIAILIERGMHAEDRAIAQQELFIKVYTIRIEAALAVLQARAANGTATVEDLMRISQCLVALERLHRFVTPYDCGT